LLRIAQSYDFSPFDLCDIILPVPLHMKRLKKRGMNQALSLCRLFFPGRREDIYTDVLVRERPTISQTSLDIWGRKKNLKNAFSLKRTDIIVNKVVCLVDDVYTTGATAEECTKSILRAGGAEVRVLTLARVVTMK
jgi:ComF family protein